MCGEALINNSKATTYERAVERSRKRVIDELEEEIPEADNVADEGNSVSTQTDLSTKDMDEEKANRHHDISLLQMQLEETREEQQEIISHC